VALRRPPSEDAIGEAARTLVTDDRVHDHRHPATTGLRHGSRGGDDSVFMCGDRTCAQLPCRNDPTWRSEPTLRWPWTSDCAADSGLQGVSLAGAGNETI